MKPFNRVLTGGLRTRLVRVFLLQVLAISIATVLGVYAAAWVVERVLVQEALNGEAEYFWDRYSDNADFPLPDTNNLTAYLAEDSDTSTVPAWLRDEQPGFRRGHRQDDSSPVVHVSERDGDRLYLVFDEMQVSSLAWYFGIAPLTGVLLLIYLLTWVGYVMSRRAVSTVVQLADAVRNYDFRSGKLEELSEADFGEATDTETLALINAFNQFIHRLESFIQRERNFTRNASHELRTPLAVLRSNLGLLAKQSDPEARAKTVDRMNRTVRDMEALVETLLILARESESRLNWSSVVLNDLLADLLDQFASTIDRPEVATSVRANGLLEISAPERVLAIVFTNLLRNALSYTEKGHVHVLIDRNGVTVQDSGCGMSEADLERMFEPFYRGHDRSNEGYGLGLSIVRRLCDRFGWHLHADSELGAGTEIRVEFPQATFKPFSGN
ncbi:MULTISPECIES: HAMP domain-containing sensor histidine kinase [unclassified Wenzhouxiangella]|uniref:sensor histidine kinase n=1 Tax=unclassified Wenzhouxiangella TaxID=2613841 RepID=UPI000E3256C4|nr:MULTISPECIES: HAMP domain-containing sensor histidine kinase [unclassified Wenzhouxiangella]RFF28780.1 sensor histidine kinase [Wenzhouxiangella sp. 15181]RFP67816.1 sensor histidine kinase [Wenzhouxiangella sp. 15190]